MDVLVANTKVVIRVMMVSAGVIKICHHFGCVQAQSRGGGEVSGFDLFPGVGERVNSVWGSGVVSNSECAQVNGNT
jgi:hypothetical protein